MFNRNDPAMPCVTPQAGGFDTGLTKFERCAVEFTAAWLVVIGGRVNSSCSINISTNNADVVASILGIQTAEEFCKQMEEREKDAKP